MKKKEHTETSEIIEEVEELLQDAPDVPEAHPHTSTVPVLPQLAIALAMLALIFGVTVTDLLTPTQQVAQNVRVEARPSLPTPQVNAADYFADITIQGRAAFVWDVQKQKMLYEKNSTESLPLASITKLMTALVAYELLEPESEVTLSQSALAAEGDSGFVDGERFTLQDLTDLTLIESSNDGAQALGERAGAQIQSDDAERAFVTAMNIKAKELGLAQTHFGNTTGLDLSAVEAGAYGSAEDVARLMEYILEQHADAVALTETDVARIVNTQGEYHLVKNTNEVVDDIEGLIASKTGYTRLAGGNLVVAFDAGLNRPIVVVVLGSTQEGRFVDTLALIQKTREYLGDQIE